MRRNWSSLAAFQAWLPGRILLPVGFAALVATSLYLVGNDRGYERGVAEQTASKDAAQLVTPEAMAELTTEPTEKGDRLDIPALVRAIEPESVYKPSRVAAEPAKPAGKPAVAVASLPVGVERFDTCGENCDTRDPMIVRTSYPVGSMSPSTTTAMPPAPAPGPAVVVQEEGFLGLPPLPGPGEIVDRTVKGTAATYDALKNGTIATYDTVKDALGNAMGLTR
ncbi:hypothetical protein [Ancylobacter radicis]|uniref:Uncharacterized protein n=1 Tax=Ancylobacter radicis TaxID=2836179 RepID=A0ABS5RC39_9HYPH|nr:hypothetical protein [Ancylobacter radicis]MBS9479226.1 hypothetical protein [Ancylobacter radicis]